jgi:hypothetical protein
LVFNCSMPGHDQCYCHIYWDEIVYKEKCEPSTNGFQTCTVTNTLFEVGRTQRHHSKMFPWSVECEPAGNEWYPPGAVYCDVAEGEGGCPPPYPR